MSVQEDYPPYPICYSSDDERDDYDDTPLFTRELSVGIFKLDSTKSLNSMSNKDDSQILRRTATDGGPISFNIYKTARGSIHVRESKCPRPSNSERTGLTHFESSLFSTILEDVLIQIHILGRCNNELRVLKLEFKMDDLLRSKYSVKELKNKDDVAAIDVKNLYSERNKLFKIIEDRRLCDSVMKETYLDLSLNRKYNTLIKFRKAAIGRYEYYQSLLENEAKNKAKRRELLKTLRLQRTRIKSALYETDLLVTEVMNKIEDSAFIRETRSRYVDRWQSARTSQHRYTINNKEAGPSGNITLYRRKCDDEQRVHMEVESLANIQLSEILGKVEDMMVKYDEDMEAIDIRIERMRKSFDEKNDTRIEMEQTLKDHEKEMTAWVKFKDEREAARLYRLKMNTAAIAVQAWWRGLLVRLQLGPFKPSRKKPAAAEKKKK